MTTFHMDLFSTFDELYGYWKRLDDVRTPLTAIILSTEITGLDRKITHFVIDNREELDNMSGEACAVFMATPQKNIQKYLVSKDLVRGYREISYAIGRLLGVLPEQFPSIVFFDNLIRPKQTVILSLASLLGPEPADGEIAAFFRSLFTITHQVSGASPEQPLKELQQAISKKWQNKQGSGIDFAKIVSTAVSLTELSQNIVSLINGVILPLREVHNKLL